MMASRIPGAKALPSAESLIESPDVDALIIASSDATHAKLLYSMLESVSLTMPSWAEAIGAVSHACLSARTDH